MTLLLRFLLINVFIISILHNDPPRNNLFSSPLKIPLLFSSSFGDLRIDHYHSGIDIKTQGVTGKEVVASADGYIYRITVSPGGFGKALYIRHPSGYSTVYGHLDRFAPPIEEYVRSKQYEKMSYLITVFPGKEQFPVTQGDLIAYSGNSGSSGGPHLHYEIRKSESEIPVNPLLFELGTADNIEPVFEKLVIYPVNKHSLINNQNSPKKVNVTGGNGRYYLPPDNEISIAGLAGFGIKAYDLQNTSSNKFAVYSIELSIDSITTFRYVMDGFSFDESRYINSHIDYETYLRENIYIERTFVLPNDKLNVYKDVINRGVINFNDNELHQVVITIKDIQNNKATLSFKVRSTTEGKKESTISEIVTKNDELLMPYGKTNRFTSDNISVNIPAGALYDTIDFIYKKENRTDGMFSDLHCVHSKYTPVHKAYTLSIKPDIIPPGKKSKMLIAQKDEGNKRLALNSKWSGEYITSEVLSFGNFYIGIDTIPPVISSNGLISKAVLSGRKEMRISINDEFSGIKAYEPRIDGKWALFEYDQKNNVLIYQFDETRITRGSGHKLSLAVSDNKDNISYFNCDFIW